MDSLPSRPARMAAALWIGILLADYFLQFFTSRYWTDHALPFACKILEHWR